LRYIRQSSCIIRARREFLGSLLLLHRTYGSVYGGSWSVV